jgi:hypothetical protein
VTNRGKNESVVVVIVNVSATKIRVKDASTGGQFDVSNEFGISEQPVVGDTWLLQEVSPRIWRFVARYDTKRAYSSVKFSMVVDALDCLGLESTVVEQIARMGIQEIVLNAAYGGVLYWDSPLATTYGLVLGQDVVSRVVTHAKRLGLSVQVMIDSTLWDDIAAHEAYLQHVYVSGSMPAISTTTVSQISPLNARTAVAALVAELCSVEPTITGVVLRGMQYHDRTADYSLEVLRDYKHLKGAYPPVAVDVESASWWTWQDYRETLWGDFFTVVKAAVPAGKTFTFLSTERLWMHRAASGQYGESDGRIDTGLGDSLGGTSVPYVGIDIQDFEGLAGDTDDVRMGTFGFCLALAQRFAGNGFPTVCMSVNKTSTVLQWCIKSAVQFGVAQFMFRDYGDIVSEADVRSIADVIKSSLTYTLSDAASIGVLCSSDSRDRQAAVGEYSGRVETQMSLLGCRSDFPVRVLFDDDIVSAARLSAVRVIAMFECSVMSAAAQTFLRTCLETNRDKRLVAIGETAVRNTVLDAKATSPLWAWFGLTCTGNETSVAKDLTLKTSAPVMSNTSFGLGTVAYLQVVSGTSALVNQFVDADLSLFVSGRSVLVGFSMCDMESVGSLLPWRLILYAVGRD